MELFDTDFVQFGQVLQICRSGKITTTPRLFSKHSLKKEKKKQRILNVHTKWNCLIPILSSLVKYYLFQARKC